MTTRTSRAVQTAVWVSRRVRTESQMIDVHRVDAPGTVPTLYRPAIWESPGTAVSPPNLLHNSLQTAIPVT
jgi:hypothetical protein